jgi:opacity protein-like surface antigen
MHKDLGLLNKYNVYLDAGLGVRSFKNDYKKVYDDISETNIGLIIGTGLEMNNIGPLKPFLGVRLNSFISEKLENGYGWNIHWD